MRFPSILAVLLLWTTSASSTPVSIEDSVGFVESDQSALIQWPGTASGYRARRQLGMAETNGERLRRGLKPARPVVLYQSPSIEKRLLTPPSTASGTNRLYRFQNCYSQQFAGRTYKLSTLTFTSLQDFAEQCARQLDQTNNPQYQTFILKSINPTTGYCGTDILFSDGSVAPCSASNQAGYSA